MTGSFSRREAQQALAEDAFVYTPRWPSQTWRDEERFYLLHGPNPHHLQGLVLRLRLGEDVEEPVREVRAWFAAHGRRHFTWLVGDSATPRELRRELLRLGAEPDRDEPVFAGMASDAAPPAVSGVEARPVASFDEFAAARELSWEATGVDEAMRAGARSRLRAAWNDYRNLGVVVFVVQLEGRVVACGGVSFTPHGGYLAGAATHPDHRGRGCYRALVRARWEAAAARGTPVAAAHAGKMSRPILRRLGFRQLATVHALVDESSR